jgi:predicted phosphodiesterase
MPTRDATVSASMVANPADEPRAELTAATRIGLIGDVHTEADLLELAIRALAALRADLVLCVGDIATGPGDLARCCSLLLHHGIPTVRGNHDRWLLADLSQDPRDPEVRRRVPAGILAHLSTLRARTPRTTVDFLSGLPPVRWFRTSRGLMQLCHGLGPNDLAGVTPQRTAEDLADDPDLQGLLAEPGLRLVLNGHTHRPMVRAIGGLTIVNAGTLEQNQNPGVALIDLDDKSVMWVPLTEGGALAPSLLGTIGSGE